MNITEVSYADVRPFLDAAADSYAGEVGLGQARSPDHNSLEAADDAGMLVTVGAYNQGRLVGVLIFTISGSLVNTESREAVELLFYVDPQGRHKGVASGMLSLGEQLITERGCDKIVMCSMDANPIDSFLRGRGYGPQETWYSKEIG